MLTIKIRNTGTGTQECSHYEYAVLVNDELISLGGIANHNRNDGWVKLVEMLCETERKYHEVI